jgi:hypothetical protein
LQNSPQNNKLPAFSRSKSLIKGKSLKTDADKNLIYHETQTLDRILWKINHEKRATKNFPAYYNKYIIFALKSI